MPKTRILPTTYGEADFNLFREVAPGGLFLDGDGIEETSKTDVSDGVTTRCPFMKLDKGDLAVNLDTGATRKFIPESKVLLLHQRNMWEMWC